MSKISQFKLEYITITLAGNLILVLLLMPFSGWATFKDVINIVLGILFLVFLTFDIKKYSEKTCHYIMSYKYFGLIFIFLIFS